PYEHNHNVPWRGSLTVQAEAAMVEGEGEEWEVLLAFTVLRTLEPSTHCKVRMTELLPGLQRRCLALHCVGFLRCLLFSSHGTSKAIFPTPSSYLTIDVRLLIHWVAINRRCHAILTD